MMKSTGKNPKADVWEVLIDVDVDGNGGIYISAQNTSQRSLKIINHHPTSSEVTKHRQIIRPDLQSKSMVRIVCAFERRAAEIHTEEQKQIELA
ncbi:hypothetical protein HA466_0124180 [Hirschfeldia incana]|nr:hypothetical protein HA466_0124180 [Hirschfeldia incana]